MNLGYALMEQGKFVEASAELHIAIELDPRSAMAHNNLGLALYHQDKRAEAVAEYQRAIELDPKFAFAHNNLGVVLESQGKLSEAAAEFRKAIEIDREYPHPKSAWGRSCCDSASPARHARPCVAPWSCSHPRTRYVRSPSNC
jgi:Tfp pilus assembly protein PilF